MKFVLALSFALLASTASAQSVVHVSNRNELIAALPSADAGTQFVLAPGDYGDLVIRSLAGDPSAPIVFRSGDSANPAIITGLSVRQAENIVFDDLKFDYTFAVGDPNNARPFEVFSTRAITFQNSLFDGSLDDGPEGQPFPTAFGLNIRASSEVIIEGNEFTTFYRGLVLNDVTDVVLIENDFHAIRMDGVNLAQIERLLVQGNYFHDFSRAIDSKDHSDMIQMWTNGTERPSRNIVVRGNIFNSGQGFYTQSIFFRNDQVDRGLASDEMFYRDVLIEDNVIINAHLHGITIGETDGLVIQRNTVVQNPMSAGPESSKSVWIPRITVAGDSRNVTITSNAVQEVSGYLEQADWKVTNNLLLQNVRPNRLGYYGDLFLDAVDGDPRRVESFIYKSGGALDASGLGAPMLNGPLTGAIGQLVAKSADQIVPQVMVSSRGNDFFYALDASSTHFPLKEQAEDAIFRWAFADGTTVAGPIVEHDFSRQEKHFELAVVLHDGSITTRRFRFDQIGRSVLELSEASGAFISFVSGSPLPSTIVQNGYPIQLGQGGEPITLTRRDIAPLFESDNFKLSLGLRAVDGHRSAGQLMYLHKGLDVSIGGRGIVTVKLTMLGGQEYVISSEPTTILDGNWHDLELVYSNTNRVFQLLVDGTQVGSRDVQGLFPALEFWGISMGHPFGHVKDFDGEMRAFALEVDRGHFSATAY